MLPSGAEEAATSAQAALSEAQAQLATAEDAVREEQRRKKADEKPGWQWERTYMQTTIYTHVPTEVG